MQKSDSLYNSPVFCVPKKGGNGLRIVQDFRELNQKSYMDKYTMKDIHECIGDIGKSESTIFSTIDLTSGFWQMPLHKDSIPKTAFTLPGLGQYEWLTSPMGLIGCPASFQRLMDKIMDKLTNAIVYIDDILIHSKTHDSHLVTLDEVLQRLTDNNMKINLAKCHFGNTEVSYLGFRLTPEGITPGKDKLKAVEKAKIPETKEEIKSFVGLCNFFRTHVQGFAKLCAPLNKATRKDSTYKSGPITGEILEAYLKLKEILCSEPVMAYPRGDRTYALIVDASTGTAEIEGGMGAILAQIDNKGVFHALSYASKQLIKHEKNYSPYLLEMDAVVWAMEYYQEHLRGRRFIVYTDHEPLESMGTLHTKTLNRLTLAMLDFDFEIRYKKGSEMPADFLSRSFNQTCAISILDKDWVDMQGKDTQCKLIKEALEKKWAYKFPMPIWYKKAEELAKIAVIRNNILWIKTKANLVIYVPYSLRHELMTSAHGDLMVGHDGVKKCKERITECYYWPDMDNDLRKHMDECLKCQVSKKAKFEKTVELQPLPQCSMPNQRIHMDLFGPCKTSDAGNKYVLTMTDAFTKYAEIVAIPNKEAVTVADAIFTKWICRYGCPAIIHTDMGKEFINKITSELYAKLDIKGSKTTPAHPQCNSQAEVFNKTLAKYMKTVVDETTLNWEWYLAPLMFSYNTSYHSTTKTTPFNLLYGMKPRLPSFPVEELQRINYGEGFVAERMQLLQQARRLAESDSSEASEKYKEHHDRAAKVHDFQVGDEVLIDNQLFVSKNKKFSPMWIGPFVITKIINKQNVEVKIKNRAQIYNVCRLKRFIDPKSSKFKDDESIKRHTVNPNEQNDTHYPQIESEGPIEKHRANELIKNSIERRVTRSMKRLISKEEVSISAINSLIIPEADRYKLTSIALKLHQSISLTQSEKNYWQNFSKEEKSYIITGDAQQTLDFTQYQQGYYSGNYWNLVIPEPQAAPNPTLPAEEDSDTDPDPDLAADEPPLSESSEEETPVFRRTGTKDSGFNPVSDDSRSQQSARTTPPESVSTPRQGTLNQEYNSPSSPEEFSTPPQTIIRPKGRPKGSKNIKRVYFDAEAIGQRTRSKLHKGEYDDDGDYLMPVVNDAVIFSCSTWNASDKPESSSDFFKYGTFCNQCELPSCQNSCQPDYNHGNSQTGHPKDQSTKQECLHNDNCGIEKHSGIQQKRFPVTSNCPAVIQHSRGHSNNCIL